MTRIDGLSRCPMMRWWWHWHRRNSYHLVSERKILKSVTWRCVHHARDHSICSLYYLCLRIVLWPGPGERKLLRWDLRSFISLEREMLWWQGKLFQGSSSSIYSTGDLLWSTDPNYKCKMFSFFLSFFLFLFVKRLNNKDEIQS